MRASREAILRTLSLLQKWGWETGFSKLKAEIESYSNSSERVSQFLFLAWIAGERGKHDQSLELLRVLEDQPGYDGWSLTAQAYIAQRERDYECAHHLLDEADRRNQGHDVELQATIDHCRGALHFHQDSIQQALDSLRKSFEGFGKDHFKSGRVLDTLGMIYAAKDNFNAASELYCASLEIKQKYNDALGLAITYGNLGRLHLDWGFLDRAEHYFVEDLKIATRISDRLGEVRMYNDLGRIQLERGQWRNAEELFTLSRDKSRSMGIAISEAFACKDLAIALLNLGKPNDAEVQLKVAERLFAEKNYPEGAAFVNRTFGIMGRIAGDLDDANRRLNVALEYFQQNEQWSEAARTQLEIVRVLAAGEFGSTVTVYAIREAMRLAESCRRPQIIDEVEHEFRGIDEAEYWRHIHGRVRGRGVQEKTVSLSSGEHESATILFLDLQGSTEIGHQTDPKIIMLDLNQMFAELSEVLKRYEAMVSAYCGDGFMAMFRGCNDAIRAVQAALEIFEKVDEFNMPRTLLDREPLRVRVGIDTGEVYIGNVGTYDKMAFSAIGTTCNRAARIECEADPGIPRISESTFQLVRDNFVFREESPKEINAKGFSLKLKVWDVVARTDD